MQMYPGRVLLDMGILKVCAGRIFSCFVVINRILILAILVLNSVWS